MAKVKQILPRAHTENYRTNPQFAAFFRGLYLARIILYFQFLVSYRIFYFDSTYIIILLSLDIQKGFITKPLHQGYLSPLYEVLM